MSTTNAYIFAWDMYGIEAIVPITQYENWDAENTWRILKDEKPIRNPVHGIASRLILRAKFNSQRHYEIYVIDCSEEMDEEFWKEQWEQHPQETAELIRERGYKMYSDRIAEGQQVIIT